MGKMNRVISRGKPGLSKHFQEFEIGDSAAVVKEPTVDSKFPLRLQGKTGTIEGRRGKSYILGLKDQNEKKQFLIAPIHLKKIKQIKAAKADKKPKTTK
ncbi:MAG TPA: 50S ribosomal protein L21e [Candidatus Pacearchaeota archaeon]|nr:50S ribosomal protein L21e [Candidatus Pacearchaeota archaeon]